MPNHLIIFFIKLFLVYCLIIAVLFFFENTLIYPGAKRNTDLNNFDFLVEKIQISNFTIETFIYENKENKKNILYFGGNAEDVAISLYQLKKMFPSSNIYSFNYPNYGASEGETNGLNEEKMDFIIEEYLKLDFLQNKKFIITGRSLGSGFAVKTAYKHQSILEKLLLITPYDSMKNTVKSLYPYIPTFMLDNYMQNPIESHLFISKINNPIKIIYADGDTLIKNKLTENLILKNKNIEAIKLKNETHNSIFYGEQIVFESHSFIK